MECHRSAVWPVWPTVAVRAAMACPAVVKYRWEAKVRR